MSMEHSEAVTAAEPVANTAAETAVSAAPETEAAQEEHRSDDAVFEELIRGQYKDAFDERVRKILNGRLKKLRQENESLQGRVARQEEAEAAGARELVRGAAALRERYPDYDPVREAENPVFVRLVRAGVDGRTAYEAVHHEELLRQAMAYAARRAVEQTTRSIASGAGRIPENGGGSVSVSRSDPRTLTSRDLADIRRRVMGGEKIRF